MRTQCVHPSRPAGLPDKIAVGFGATVWIYRDLAAPEVGGGIDHVPDSLKHVSCNEDRYAKEFNNCVIFKRLGYLAETQLHDGKLAPELPPKKRYCLASLIAVCQETNGSMINKREILEAASSFSLLPNTVEKDYVLGWILAGSNAHAEPYQSWIFKGGTCLNKCYFETYRFSGVIGDGQRITVFHQRTVRFHRV